MSNTTASGRPTTVTVSFVIWLVVVLLGVISGIIGLTASGSDAADQVGSGLVVGTAVFAIVVAVIELIIVFKMRDGRNWARIVLTVLAVLQVLGVFAAFSAVNTITLIAVIVATVLLFLPASNAYFRRR